jgi:hypothetical protein
MNERIKELAKQAGIQDNPDQEGLDLFAQLIIQDCADLAYRHNIFSRGRAWNLVVKEHFDFPIVDTDIPPYLRTTGVTQ